MFVLSKKSTLLVPALIATLSACSYTSDESALDYDGYNDSPYYEPASVHDGENYKDWGENPFVDTAVETTSTFSIDVDTGSYTLMRRDLRSETLPAVDGVRIEEYINYFDYAYPTPEDDRPFAVHMEVAPSHFEENVDLLRIGVQGKEIGHDELKPTNLVFLIDVSGSMQSEDKLPLVKRSLYALIDNLRDDDRVGIVTYASGDRVVLPSTPVGERATITGAIEDLRSGGGTNGEAGIVTAYEMAEANLLEDGNNRVVLLTDGDFNVGKRNDDLIDYVVGFRDRQISLTTVGYGRGNYNDYMMEQLANRANGNYFYVDTLAEAERIFGSDLPSTLEVIASDVKIQVEFDAETVESYRLVGYENRVLDNEDFDDDTKDAGEIGPGHNVTALYELRLKDDARTTRLADVRIRYKAQYGEESQLIESTIKTSSRTDFDQASDEFRFAAAVAEYAQILGQSAHSQDARFDDVIAIATDASHGENDRAEFIELVKIARGLWGQ